MTFAEGALGHLEQATELNQVAAAAGAVALGAETTVATTATGERIVVAGEADPEQPLSGALAADESTLTRAQQLDLRVGAEMSPHEMALAQLSIMGLTKSDIEAESDKVRAADAARKKAHTA